MANVLVEEGSLQAVADGLRYANGTANTYTPAQMGPAVQGLKKTLVSKTVTANGTYDPADDSADGYSGVTVNVNSGVPLMSSVRTYNGYISSGIFSYDGGAYSYSVDVYTVSANHSYIFFNQSVYGNRWRLAFFTSNIAEATGNISGSSIYQSDSQSYPLGTFYRADSNGYVGVMSSNQNRNTRSYGIDLSALSV